MLNYIVLSIALLIFAHAPINAMNRSNTENIEELRWRDLELGNEPIENDNDEDKELETIITKTLHCASLKKLVLNQMSYVKKAASEVQNLQQFFITTYQQQQKNGHFLPEEKSIIEELLRMTGNAVTITTYDEGTLSSVSQCKEIANACSAMEYSLVNRKNCYLLALEIITLKHNNIDVENPSELLKFNIIYHQINLLKLLDPLEKLIADIAQAAEQTSTKYSLIRTLMHSRADLINALIEQRNEICNNLTQQTTDEFTSAIANENLPQFFLLLLKAELNSLNTIHHIITLKSLINEETLLQRNIKAALEQQLEAQRIYNDSCIIL